MIYTKRIPPYERGCGDPKIQKEVFSEPIQEISTRRLAMQIPHSLVPEIPVSDIERRIRSLGSGHYQAVIGMATDRDYRGQCAGGPYPSGAFDSAQVFGL